MIKTFTLPRRQRTAHKGDFGHVLIIGGDTGMPGAVRMTALAALRTGAGAVSVITQPENMAAIVAAQPEIMCYEPTHLDVLLTKATVIAIGPGMAATPWSQDLVHHIVNTPQPKVIDAGALHYLTSPPRHAILTPHPGEASVLLQVSAAEVQADRVKAVWALQAKFKAIAVLKGAGTLVAGEQQPLWQCAYGNPGMASAGMGDVLTGVIAGLLAQGLAPFLAACMGVELHARAADRAAAQVGEYSLIATDVINQLIDIVHEITE